MKIALDLNDVIRDYSDNFVKVYLMNYNHEFDLDDFDPNRALFHGVYPPFFFVFPFGRYIFALYGRYSNTITTRSYGRLSLT